MSRLLAPELPAEVVERIFRVERPGGESGEPLLSDKERFRCQLVCQAWRHALAASRWPLWQLKLAAHTERPYRKGSPPPPAAALWVQRVRPAVQRLRIQLGSGEGGFAVDSFDRPRFKSAPVQAVHKALLALHPADALHSLDITAPWRVLKRLVPDLGRFTGLRQLELQALRYVDCDIEDQWDEAAVLTTALLRYLPPRLERLTAANFCQVQLWEEEEEEEEGSSDEGSSSSSSEEGSTEAQHEGSSSEDESSGSDLGRPGSGSGSRHSGSAGRAGRAAAASSAAPARLPPGLTQLRICAVETVELGIVLNSLVELSATCCNRVRLIGQQLHLPQLTSLSLALPPFVEAQFVAELRCAAMPALAPLSTSFPIRPWGSFAALQQLTRLDLDPVDSFGLQHCLPLLQGLAPRLRRLSVGTQYQDIDANCAARVAAAAAGAPLTQLELDSLACLPRLPTWPTLQELRLCEHPSSVTAEHVALLAAAPSLRHLAFYSPAAERAEERQRMQELRQALPGCTVDTYQDTVGWVGQWEGRR